MEKQLFKYTILTRHWKSMQRIRDTSTLKAGERVQKCLIIKVNGGIKYAEVKDCPAICFKMTGVNECTAGDRPDHPAFSWARKNNVSANFYSGRYLKSNICANILLI